MGKKIRLGKITRPPGLLAYVDKTGTVWGMKPGKRKKKGRK